MTVQALRLSMSKEFPDYNFDDILGSLNAGNSLDLPIPSQELPNLCCFDDNLLDFDRDGNWGSPDGEDECAFAFGGVMKSEGDTRTPLPPSITLAPDSAASPVTSAFNSTEKTDGGSAAQGVNRFPVTTGVPGVATRLRTGAQAPKRLLSSAESMSGSESSSPTSELGDASAIADLPELKFKKGKRKKDVDLDMIDDPQERRKQRRLAKNRATAALSRPFPGHGMPPQFAPNSLFSNVQGLPPVPGGYMLLLQPQPGMQQGMQQGMPIGMGQGGQQSFTLVQGMGGQAPNLNMQFPNPESGSGNPSRTRTQSRSRHSGTPFEQHSVRGGTPDVLGGGDGRPEDDRDLAFPHSGRGGEGGGDGEGDPGDGPGLDPGQGPGPEPRKLRRSTRATSGSRSRSDRRSSRGASHTETEEQGGDEANVPPPSAVDWDKIFPINPSPEGVRPLDAPADVRPTQKEAVERSAQDGTVWLGHGQGRPAGPFSVRAGSLPNDLSRPVIGGFDPSAAAHGPPGDLVRRGSLLTPQGQGQGMERGGSLPRGKMERAGSLLNLQGFPRAGSLRHVSGRPPAGHGSATSRLARPSSHHQGLDEQIFRSPFANAPMQQNPSMQLPGSFLPGQFSGNAVGGFGGGPIFAGGAGMPGAGQLLPVQWPNAASPQFVSGQMHAGGQMQFLPVGSAAGFGAAQGQSFNFVPVIPGGGPAACNFVPQFQPVMQTMQSLRPYGSAGLADARFPIAGRQRSHSDPLAGPSAVGSNATPGPRTSRPTGGDGLETTTSNLPATGNEGGEQQALPMPDPADWFPPSLPGSPAEGPSAS